MVEQVRSAALETFLTHATAGRVHFRDQSWQADTVYRRQRPLNFGSQGDMLERIGATAVIASFGQMEAMDGVGRLPEFIQAYEGFLDDEVLPRIEKIVLITPIPFTRAEGNPHLPDLPDLPDHNDAIRAYSRAIVELAERRGWPAVDLSRFDATGLTLDGLQLTPEGQEKWALAVTRKLLGEPASVLPENAGALREMIRRKNILWTRYWRPTNWAFLYGDRQRVPSSHDHRPGQPRWFPEEIDDILPLIQEAETGIANFRTTSKP